MDFIYIKLFHVKTEKHLCILEIFWILTFLLSLKLHITLDIRDLMSINSPWSIIRSAKHFLCSCLTTHALFVILPILSLASKSFKAQRVFQNCTWQKKKPSRHKTKMTVIAPNSISNIMVPFKERVDSLSHLVYHSISVDMRRAKSGEINGRCTVYMYQYSVFNGTFSGWGQ